MTGGHVDLVGAGPGDPELLTLKALKSIQQASILLVDDLVSDAIVALADARARIIRVGKRGGCKSTPQSFIERLMITAAQEGERVVRLKGGDPFIFGRGGEEVERLQAAGVSVAVINGITSGLAAATALGVPLTHRDHAQGVIFLTGHTQAAQTSALGRAPQDQSPSGGGAIDWPAIGALAHQARLTLVIYMGIQGAVHIQAGLMQSLPADTPVALVQNASRPEQRHALCPLAELHAVLQREQLGSPSVMVVGNVSRSLLQTLAVQDSAAVWGPGLGARAG